MIRIFARLILPLIGCIYLVSCGAATGRGTSIPVGTTPPPPAPGPINYDTREYRNNYGLDQIKAIVAYENEATGAGITVAVIDSGVEIDNSQIAANIHPDSTNIVTGQESDLNDVDGHGTAVAGIIAAVRDPSDNTNVNTHGVAFDAQVLVINAAETGSCISVDGCAFFDSDIAAAIDYARVRGVKIINISLGGDGFNSPTLIAAYRRAVEAGMIIIVAAGNRDDTDTDLDLARPENSASVAWEDWANGQIIIAGAVDETSTIGDFSHRAGEVAKDVFLVAGGDQILSILSNDDNEYYLLSGTSFSTPHIAGAAALLMQAFPNLTGKQVADLLFDTATDLGAVGADVVYGRGLINLEEAFSPQGVASIAVRNVMGETSIVSMDATVLVGGTAFGDFASLSGVIDNSMMLDGYDRSYRVNLGQRIFNKGETIQLESLLSSRKGSRTSSLLFSSSAKVRFSWTEDWRFQEVDEQYFSHQNNAKNRYHNLRMKLDLSLGEDQDMTIAQGLSLKEALEDYDQDDFLSIGREDFIALIGQKDSQSAIFGQKITPKTKLDLVMGHGAAEWQQYNLKADSYVMMARLDHRLTSRINLGIDLGVMNEDNSVLGSLSNGAISLGKGATTTFINGRFDLNIGGKANFFAKASYGWTNVTAAELSLVEQIESLTSGSFSMGVTGHSLLQKGDRLSFAISQPLRVMGGHGDVSYVTARDYTIDSLSFISNQVSLAPGGREIDFELAYRVADFLGAQVDINILHQISPGHSSASPDNTGVLIRFGSEF